MLQSQKLWGIRDDPVLHIYLQIFMYLSSIKSAFLADSQLISRAKKLYNDTFPSVVRPFTLILEAGVLKAGGLISIQGPLSYTI